jgi:peroxidase
MTKFDKGKDTDFGSDAYKPYYWGFDPLAHITPRSPTGGGLVDQSHPETPIGQSVFQRLTPAHYAGDGKGGTIRSGPDAELISDTVLKVTGDPEAVSLLNTNKLNENFSFFGQFLTHDLDQALPTTIPATVPTEALNVNGLPFPFVRSEFVTDSNGVRQQVSDVTPFLDLSQVYGSSAQQLHLVRTEVNGHDGAKLIVGADNMLATVADIRSVHGSVEASDQIIQSLVVVGPGPLDPNTTFFTGDSRINQNAELTAETLVWVKEHNYQVDQLSKLHPNWTQDQLFNAARAVTTAEYQHIVYDEYLTKLLGPGALDSYHGYNPNQNPAISNEFAAAAFRFGHDESSNILYKLGIDGSVSALTLGQAFNTAAQFASSADFDALLRGLTAEHGQQIDGQVQDGNRVQLFGIPNTTVDLEVFDIMRGRDHGIGTIGEVRHDLGLREYTSYLDLTGGNKAMADKLESAYGAGHWNDVDLVIAGMVEKHVNGGELGETFADIVTLQFEATRSADPLWYENEFKNDPALLHQIDNTTFADILSRNSASGDHFASDAFSTVNRIVVDTASGDVHGDTTKLVDNSWVTDDLIIVRDGTHKVWGGTGQDTFAIDQHAAAGDQNIKVTIQDFNVKQDKLDLTQFGLKDNADLYKHEKVVFDHGQVSTVISNGHGDQIMLIGVKPMQLTASNFVHDPAHVTSLV